MFSVEPEKRYCTKIYEYIKIIFFSLFCEL